MKSNEPATNGLAKPKGDGVTIARSEGSRRRAVRTPVTTDLQIAQSLLRQAFALSHERLSPAAQRALFEFAIELVAREGRRHWR
jgi:hypothetical protein